MAAALAQGRLRSEPGTRSEYLGATFAYLVGEIVRRIDGRPLDEYFREEVAEPLGVDFVMAVGPDDDDRCAELVGPEDMVGGRNTRAYRAANGHGSADGIARVYAALARGGELDGVRVLAPSTVELMHSNQVGTLYSTNGMGFGLGFSIVERIGADNTPTSVGTYGWGGAYGSQYRVDPKERIVWVFMINQLPNRADVGQKFPNVLYGALVK